MADVKPSGPLWSGLHDGAHDAFSATPEEGFFCKYPCRLIPGHGKVVPLELVNNLVGAVDDYIDADEGDDKRERNAELVAALRAAIEGAL